MTGARAQLPSLERPVPRTLLALGLSRSRAMLMTRHVDLIGGYLDGGSRVVSVPMSTVLSERYIDHTDQWWAQRYVLILGAQSSCYAAVGEPVKL